MIRPSFAENASPEAFAEAMIRCQMYAPACSDAGECALENYCFGRDGQGFARARKELEKARETFSGDVYARVWVKLAIDALDHHRFLGAKGMDALKYVAIHKRVREEYGASI